MSLDPLLLNLLACPIDKQALLYLAEDDVLYNPRLRRLYRVRDGIPVMLADQGETVSDDRHRDLLRRAAAGGALTTLQVALRDVLASHLADAHAVASRSGARPATRPGSLPMAARSTRDARAPARTQPRTGCHRGDRRSMTAVLAARNAPAGQGLARLVLAGRGGVPGGLRPAAAFLRRAPADRRTRRSYQTDTLRGQRTPPTSTRAP